MGKEIYVLTTNYPYGLGEPFLNTESAFLAKRFEKVHYVPMWIDGERRDVPDGTIVEKPMLGFNPKGNMKLVVKGLFCLSPFFFAIPIFFKEKAWKGKRRLWDFMTAFLLVRAMYASWPFKLDENVLLYSYWGDKTALLLPLFKKRFGCVCVSRFHGTDLYEEACGGYKPFRKWLFKGIDVAIPVSDSGEHYLRERYGEDAPKAIEVHRLGTFDQGLNPQEGRDVFQIVSCSNIIPVKRVALLAEAIGGLGFKVEWTHIGDGPLRQEVETLMAGYPDHVKGALLGAMPNKKVLEYYSAHHIDLFVNVSESEGVPVSIMEALSFGIPVMATNVGGVSEIVDDAVGRLLPADVSALQLKEAIARVYNSNRLALREQARKRWENRSDALRNYSAFCDFLAGL